MTAHFGEDAVQKLAGFLRDLVEGPPGTVKEIHIENENPPGTVTEFECRGVADGDGEVGEAP